MKKRIGLLLVVLGSLAAGPGQLADGIGGLRAGMAAYGDAWQLAFWNPGQTAGMEASHNEQDFNIDMLQFKGYHLGAPVLCRLKGPGVIYRIWSAGPSGTIQFYADGALTPTVSCDFKKYLAGQCLADDAFAVGRFANYTPIPFEKSMMITVPGFRAEGAYYHVSYMTYEDDPGLKTVSAKPRKKDKAKTELGAAEEFWKSNGRKPARDPGGEAQTRVEVLALPAGGGAELRLEGAGLVTALTLADAGAPADQLSGLRLKIFYDGNGEAAVDSPVDAFFGNYFNARQKSEKGPYETLLVSATESGYESRWPMPFARGLRLVLENGEGPARRVQVGVAWRKAAALPERSMRFHARFNLEDYPDKLKKEDVHGLFYRVPQDKNYVVLERAARGYYAGCFLYVRSLGADWWGEGDEMIWVDGHDQAAIRGTGTEDEFNWSFGFKENRSPVSGALQAAKRTRKVKESDIGYSTLYRFRQADYVPFKKEIKVTYERLGSTNLRMPRYKGSPVNVTTERGDDYRSVAFWYELPGRAER